MPQTSSRFPLFVSVILGCLLLAGSSAPPSRSALPPTNNALPVLSGTAQVGRTLQVSTGTWSPTPASYEYAGSAHRCNLTVTTCQLSPTTASSPSYPLTAGDVGFGVRAAGRTGRTLACFGEQPRERCRGRCITVDAVELGAPSALGLGAGGSVVASLDRHVVAGCRRVTCTRGIAVAPQGSTVSSARPPAQARAIW